MALKPLVLVDFLSSASATGSSSKRLSLTSRDVNAVREASKAVSTVDHSASFTPSRVRVAPGSPSRLPLRSSQTPSNNSPAIPVHVYRRPTLTAGVESPSSPSRIPMKVAISRGFDRLMGRKDRAARVTLDRGVATLGAAKTAQVQDGSHAAKSPSSSIAVAKVNDKGRTLSSTRSRPSTNEVKTVVPVVVDHVSRSSPAVSNVRTVASRLQQDVLVQKLTSPVPATAELAPLSIPRCSPLVSDAVAHVVDKQDKGRVSKIISSFPPPPRTLPSVPEANRRVAQATIPAGRSPSFHPEPSESTFDSRRADPFAHGGTTSFYDSIPETPADPLVARSTPSADGSVAPLAVPRTRPSPRTFSSGPLTPPSSPLHPRCTADSVSSNIHPDVQDDELAHAELIADIHQLLEPIEHRPAPDAGPLPDSPTLGTYEHDAKIKQFINGHKFTYPLISLATASKTPTITHRTEDFEAFEQRMNSSSNPLPVTVAHAFGNTTIPMGEALELREAAKARGESGNLWSLVTPAHFRAHAGRSPALKSKANKAGTSKPTPSRQLRSQPTKDGSRGRQMTQLDEDEGYSSLYSSSMSLGEIDIGSESPLSRLVASFASEVNPPAPSSPAILSNDRPRLARATSHLTSARTVKVPRLSPHYVESVGISQKTTATAKRILRESNANIPVSTRRCGSTVAWWTAYGAMAHGETCPDQSAKSVHVRKISFKEKENAVPLKRRSRVSRRNAC
ncbi:hypothetical protein BD410DRAFT_257134 [Rickenella mellea]|uniref:Uncharacterized protein n=1 Tax=Rickenella mellea TaxID=50990 RepID=A0A4Y7Q5Z1_9AGAM|nr:hypothetical protein BD410DRAFT_257134 [Rickenella mellea]